MDCCNPTCSAVPDCGVPNREDTGGRVDSCVRNSCRCNDKVHPRLAGNRQCPLTASHSASRPSTWQGPEPRTPTERSAQPTSGILPALLGHSPATQALADTQIPPMSTWRRRFFHESTRNPLSQSQRARLCPPGSGCSPSPRPVCALVAGLGTFCGYVGRCFLPIPKGKRVPS